MRVWTEPEVRSSAESGSFRVGGGETELESELSGESESWRMEQGRGEGLGGKPEGYVGTTAGKRGEVETTARESLPESRRSRVLVGASTRWRERQLVGKRIDSLREHPQFPY